MNKSAKKPKPRTGGGRGAGAAKESRPPSVPSAEVLPEIHDGTCRLDMLVCESCWNLYELADECYSASEALAEIADHLSAFGFPGTPAGLEFLRAPNPGGRRRPWTNLPPFERALNRLRLAAETLRAYVAEGTDPAVGREQDRRPSRHGKKRQQRVEALAPLTEFADLAKTLEEKLADLEKVSFPDLSDLR